MEKSASPQPLNGGGDAATDGAVVMRRKKLPAAETERPNDRQFAAIMRSKVQSSTPPNITEMRRLSLQPDRMRTGLRGLVLPSVSGGTAGTLLPVTGMPTIAGTKPLPASLKTIAPALSALTERRRSGCGYQSVFSGPFSTTSGHAPAPGSMAQRRSSISGYPLPAATRPTSSSGGGLATSNLNMKGLDVEVPVHRQPVISGSTIDFRKSDGPKQRPSSAVPVIRSRGGVPAIEVNGQQTSDHRPSPDGASNDINTSVSGNDETKLHSNGLATGYNNSTNDDEEPEIPVPLSTLPPPPLPEATIMEEDSMDTVPFVASPPPPLPPPTVPEEDSDDDGVKPDVKAVENNVDDELVLSSVNREHPGKPMKTEFEVITNDEPEAVVSVAMTSLSPPLPVSVAKEESSAESAEEDDLETTRKPEVQPETTENGHDDEEHSDDDEPEMVAALPAMPPPSLPAVPPRDEDSPPVVSALRHEVCHTQRETSPEAIEPVKRESGEPEIAEQPSTVDIDEVEVKANNRVEGGSVDEDDDDDEPEVVAPLPTSLPPLPLSRLSDAACPEENASDVESLSQDEDSQSEPEIVAPLPTSAPPPLPDPVSLPEVQPTGFESDDEQEVDTTNDDGADQIENAERATLVCAVNRQPETLPDEIVDPEPETPRRDFDADVEVSVASSQTHSAAGENRHETAQVQKANDTPVEFFFQMDTTATSRTASIESETAAARVDVVKEREPEVVFVVSQSPKHHAINGQVESECLGEPFGNRKYNNIEEQTQSKVSVHDRNDRGTHRRSEGLAAGEIESETFTATYGTNKPSIDAENSHRNSVASNTSLTTTDVVPTPSSGSGDLKEVTIYKGNLGLGFCIAGGRGSSAGDIPIVVKRIFKGTTSVQECLQPGDEIVAANGLDFTSMSHHVAWNTLKAFPDGPVTLQIRRN